MQQFMTPALHGSQGYDVNRISHEPYAGGILANDIGPLSLKHHTIQSMKNVIYIYMYIYTDNIWFVGE